MSLRHDFYLVSTELDECRIDFHLSMKIMGNKTDPSYSVLDHIEVEDAVFDFLWFSFQWITSINPCFSDDNRYTHGIFRHGFTLYYSKSKSALETNCKSWLQLVEFAPEIIKLHDNYIDYLEKNELIAFFKRVLQFSENLDQKGIYILHSGI